MESCMFFGILLQFCAIVFQNFLCFEGYDKYAAQVEVCYGVMGECMRIIPNPVILNTFDKSHHLYKTHCSYKNSFFDFSCNFRNLNFFDLFRC